MRRKGKKVIMLLPIIIIILVLWLTWGNTSIEVSNITISKDKLPAEFAGYRIAQISDLHNAEFGDNNSKLIDLLEKSSPDIIAITGDIVDSNHTNMDSAIEFVNRIVQIAPCYYITGNHEAWIGDEYTDLEAALIDAGVTVLRDEAVTLEKNKQSIQLVGIDDPSFGGEIYNYMTEKEILTSKFDNINLTNDFTILLSHRPEMFDAYVECDMDLVFSGHAHGGQVRIPFIGGLVAPDQGVFPKYDAGIYSENNTTMVVSRGIGNSIIPLRVNNRPEIVVVELK